MQIWILQFLSFLNDTNLCEEEKEKCNAIKNILIFISFFGIRSEDLFWKIFWKSHLFVAAPAAFKCKRRRHSVQFDLQLLKFKRMFLLQKLVTFTS